MRRVVRVGVLSAVALVALVGIATPTADACMRCSLGMCIDAAHDGAASCREIMIIIRYPPIYTCELSGTCTWEGGGSGGPCQPNGCEPEQQN